MKKGDIVYLKPMSNAARRSSEIRDAVIVSVGRRYFKVDIMPRDRFCIESLLQDNVNYTSDWKAYLSKQEIEEEEEAKKLHLFIKTMIGDYSPKQPIGILRKIAEIIRNGQPTPPASK